MRTLVLFMLMLFSPRFSEAADQDFEYRLVGLPKVTDRYSSAKDRRYTVSNVHANVYGGYADVAVLPRADCSGDGQKFHFAWTFDRDVTHLNWNKPVELRMMIEGDRAEPCSDQNPFIEPNVDVLEISPVLSEARARVFFDPKSAGRPNTGAIRSVRYLKAAPQDRPARLNLEIRGFSGIEFGIQVTYSFQLGKME